MPTPFHTLPRELRHKILVETFGVAEKTEISEWTFRNIKTDIEKWTTVLQAVARDVGFQDNVKFVAEKCLEGLKKARRACEQILDECWEDMMALDNPRGEGQHAARIWETNREGEAPWFQVHLYLFEITQFWWEELNGRNTVVAQKYLEDGRGSKFIRRQLEKDPGLAERADHPP